LQFLVKFEIILLRDILLTDYWGRIWIERYYRL